MSISDLYSSGTHKREISHFASIVRLALLNGIISDNEKVIIDKMAGKLNITESEYANILKKPDDYPIIPPLDYKNRIERLFYLTKMVFADSEASADQRGLLNKISIGLGFSKDHYKELTNVAIRQIMNNKSLKEFSKAIKLVN